jgi:hypothetical protein
MADSGCAADGASPSTAAEVLCHPDIHSLIGKRLNMPGRVALRSVCRSTFSAFAAGARKICLAKDQAEWAKLLLRYGAQPKILHMYLPTSPMHVEDFDADRRRV